MPLPVLEGFFGNSSLAAGLLTLHLLSDSLPPSSLFTPGVGIAMASNHQQ